MDVIPVIDLKEGAVAHARRGERGAYRPIRSGLVEGSDPLAIAEALMALAPFRRLYVADLDAIGGGEGHGHVIRALAARFPQAEIWVDRGGADPGAFGGGPGARPATDVLGTESFDDPAALAAALAASGGVLSLDYDAAGAMGADIHRRPDLWPRRVVVMTLARVGAEAGPDLDRLRETLALAGDREVYAAGGVRNADDLEALERVGVAGALVASALHDGRLSGEALGRALASPPQRSPRP